MPDVFISYSRKDAQFVAAIERELRARGKEVWVDSEDISPASKWREEINLGLEACDGVIFVMSPDSLVSAECAKELAQALELNKRIVPVVHREPDTAVPDDLGQFNWVYLRATDDFDAGVGKLVQALDTDIVWVRAHTRLGARTAEWEAHDRNGAYLLRGADLTEAEALLTGSAGKQPEPTARQLEYVAASRTGARRRHQVLLSSVSVALVIAVALSIVAFIERGAAASSQRRAFSRQLAADAETQLSIDPELSVLLAAKAYDVNPTSESVDVLRQALATSEIRMTVRPQGGVSQAALTPDGRTLVTVARGGGQVRLWRYPGGVPAGVLPGVIAATGQMSLNPADGRMLVVDRRSGQARVFAGTNPQFAAGTAVTAAAWGAGWRYLVTGARDGTVSIFDGRSGTRLASSASAGPVVSITMSDGARYLAATSARGSLALFDLQARRMHRLASGCGDGHGIALFSSDEARLLTYGPSCDVKLWSTVGGSLIRDTGVGTNSAAFSPRAADREAGLVLGSEVGAVLNPLTGAFGQQYLGHDGVINSVAFSPDGYDVASGGSDGTVRVWEPSNPTSTLATLRAEGTGIASVSFARGASEIVSVDEDGGAARVWASGLPTWSAQMGSVMYGSAALSPDGAIALAYDAQDGAAVFDARTGQLRRQLPGSRGLATSAGGFDADAGLTGGGGYAYERAPTGVRFWRTADGAVLASDSLPGYAPQAIWAAASAARVAILWRASGGMTVEVRDPSTGNSRMFPADGIDTGAISGDGSTLALAQGQRVRVVSLASGRSRQLPLRAALGRARIVSLSFDGGRLAAAGGGAVETISLAGPRPATQLFSIAHTRATSLALSRDGLRVAAGFSDLRARAWEAGSGRLVAQVAEARQPDGQSAITAVALSPDDAFLLTSAAPDDTRIWQLATAGQLASFPEPFAGWSADSQLVLTALSGAHAWSCQVCVGAPPLRKLAQTRVTRSFTTDERSKYLSQ